MTHEYRFQAVARTLATRYLGSPSPFCVTEGPEEIWMSQEVNASTQDDAEEQYYVLHDNQESELMTLDELDTAFQEERIHEETLVCRVGDTKWLKLRELANLDEEEAEQAAPAPVASVPQPVAQPFAQPFVPAVVAPAQPQAAYVPPSFPPARTQAPAVAPYRTSSTPSAAYQPMTLSAPTSMSPMAFDLDDIDAAALRPKRRVGLIAAGIGLLAVGGIAAVSLAGSADKIAPTVAVPTAAAAAALSPSTLDSLKTSPAAPAAVPSPAPAPAVEAEAPKATGRLTDDMKAALLAQDKERETKVKAKGKGRAVAAASRRSGKAGKSSGPFKAGGSAYDPLNGKL
jgi:hypothetical protein